jgi:hypothetical protein
VERKSVRLTKRIVNVAPNSITRDVLPEAALPDGCSKLVSAPKLPSLKRW